MGTMTLRTVLKYACVSMLFAICMAAAPAARAITVNCGANQTISAAVAALKPATSYVGITVEGACTDNVYIPPNLSVALIGAKGASISPANASGATIITEGRLIVANLALTTGSFAALFANRGGYLTVLAGSITGPGTGVQVSDNSGALLQNVSIAVTGFSAVNTYAGGQVEVDGIAPIYGAKSSAISGGTAGVFCTLGSLVLNASASGILIEKSGQYGIAVNGCSVATNISGKGSITVSGNGTVNGFGAGISAQGASYLQLQGVSVTGNAYDGLFIKEGASVEISGATITGSGHDAMETAQNGIVHIVNYTGINTISLPAGNTNLLFGCYQGGKVYVDEIAGTITPAPTSANQGCLTIGGP